MARGSGEGRRIGNRVQPNSRHAFGDPEEVANRDKATYAPIEPSFTQIRPGGRPGSFNDLPTDYKSGDFKFAKGDV